MAKRKPGAKKRKKAAPNHIRVGEAGVWEHRRYLVAALITQRPGVTLRSMSTILAKEGHINPRTGEPWSHETLRRDVNALKAEWRTTRRGLIDEWFGRVIATALQTIGAGFSAGQLAAVNQANRILIDVFGLAAPTKIAPTTPSGEEEYRGLTDDRIEEFVDSILERAGERASGEPGEGGAPVDPDAGASD